MTSSALLERQQPPQQFLDFDKKKELVAALLACSVIKDRNARTTVVEQLPSEISGKIRRHDIDKIDVTNIVDICLTHQYPDSFDRLVNIVFEFDGNSEAWKKLNELWAGLRPPPYQNIPIADMARVQVPVLSTPTDYNKVGEEICIDRRWECVTFDHMRARDGKVPQRILVFQVPCEEGKSRLLKRFEFFCENDVLQQGKKLLYARIDFRDRPLQPASLVNEILRSFLENVEANTRNISGSDRLSAATAIQLRESFGAIKQSLEELRDKIKGWNQSLAQATPSEDQLLELASEMHRFCRSIADKYTVVLIFDTFEDAGNAGTWFLKYCIPKIVNMNNVIVVLAGREGLGQLKSRPEEVLFRTTLEPMLYQEDCKRWSELRYGLNINDEVAKQLINKYHGDVQQIDIALKVMNDFPNLLGV